jgi:hypothetical protein
LLSAAANATKKKKFQSELHDGGRIIEGRRKEWVYCPARALTID